MYGSNLSELVPVSAATAPYTEPISNFNHSNAFTTLKSGDGISLVKDNSKISINIDERESNSDAWDFKPLL